MKVFPRLAIVAWDVAFGNGPWGSRAEMAKIKRIEGEIALLPPLCREISVVRFVTVEPDVLRETDAKGFGSWESAPTTPAAVDESAALSLDARELAIERGVPVYQATKGSPVDRFVDKRLGDTRQPPSAPRTLPPDHGETRHTPPQPYMRTNAPSKELPWVLEARLKRSTTLKRALDLADGQGARPVRSRAACGDAVL